MMFASEGSSSAVISPEQAKGLLFSALERLGPRRRVLAVPPDGTRAHSRAGELTTAAWEYYGASLVDVLPALGTHTPMTNQEIAAIFGKLPPRLIRVHDWRHGVRKLGSVPADFVKTVSEGCVDYDIPLEVAKLVAEGGHDLILSVGQVVPHEVAGMAGHAKNIFVGTGGSSVINRTHFLGAAYGMERIMGRTDTPVRRVLSYGVKHFTKDLPIVYVLTVVGNDAAAQPVLRGLFVGDDEECFTKAAALALAVNVQLLDEPVRKVVTYLDPAEFKSTWLGNKSIYRTRMAIADGGELVVLAPGVKRFGEDDGIDRLVRKYGYVGTPRLLELVRREPELQQSLSTAAHLIHGSSEGRFTVTYCPGGLTAEQVKAAGYDYGELATMLARYDPKKLAAGFNTMPDGETIYFIPNPALGLWATRARFGGSSKGEQ
jgi:nickel-dependent lactate racemase